MTKPDKFSCELDSLEAVESLARKFSVAISLNKNSNLVIYLKGNLGVGKTAFVRAVLKHLGYSDRVKSPTYTIVEPYVFGPYEINHFDLYRLVDAEELLYLGIEDYFTEKSIVFVEWPENGGEELPKADLIFCYQYGEQNQENNQSSEQVRKLEITAKTLKAEIVLNKLVNIN